MITPRTPPGTMELLPREQAAFQKMLSTIQKGFESFGFVPVETPVFELRDVLLTKSGGDTEKQVYFVQSTGALQKGDRPELALRFDLTVPLARYVAEHEPELVFPFRRYQMQRVYRGESAQKGRFREFYQCDIDVIGKDSLSLRYDAEIPAIIYGIFQKLDIGPFTIRVNNRKLLSGLLQSVGVEAGERQADVLREIDKLDKKGLDAVKAALVAGGMEPTAVESLMGLVTAEGSSEELLARLEALGGGSEKLREGIRELKTVVDGVGELGVPASHFKVDLSIARGLDYYTGTVYETILTEHPGLGSVCSGGRYEDLAGLYTKSRLPGVGISIGATRLFDQLKERLVQSSSSLDVLITRFDSRYSRELAAIGQSLREAGLRVEVVQEDWKPRKQLQYADRIGAPYVVIVGEREMGNGVVTLKDTRTGQQQTVTSAQLATTIQAGVCAAPTPCNIGAHHEG